MKLCAAGIWNLHFFRFLKMKINIFCCGYNGFGQILTLEGTCTNRYFKIPTKLDVNSRNLPVHNARNVPSKADWQGCPNHPETYHHRSRTALDSNPDPAARSSSFASASGGQDQDHKDGIVNVNFTRPRISDAPTLKSDLLTELSLDNFQMIWSANAINFDGGVLMGYVHDGKESNVNLSSFFNDSPRVICPHGDNLFCIDQSNRCHVLELSDTKRTAKQSKRVHSSSCTLATARLSVEDIGDSRGTTEAETFSCEIRKGIESDESTTYSSSENSDKCLSECSIFKRISSGDSDVLAVADPDECVGRIARSDDGSYVLHRFPHPTGVKMVSCGKEHTLVLTDQGLVYSFGLGSRGQLGHGDVGKEENPRLVEAIASVTMETASAGGWHSACVSDIGDLYIWGWNESGQLGFPAKSTETSSESSDLTGPTSSSSSPSSSPEAVTFQMTPEILDLPGGVNVSKVSCGSRHTAAVTCDKRLYTWGWGKYGQLGHGDVQSHDEPKQVDFFLQNRLYVEDVGCGGWNTVIQTSPAPAPFNS